MLIRSFMGIIINGVTKEWISIEPFLIKNITDYFSQQKLFLITQFVEQHFLSQRFEFYDVKNKKQTNQAIFE